MAITKEVSDELLKEYRGPDDMYGPDGLIKQPGKALIERAMQAELTERIGYGKNEGGDKAAANRRNGKPSKTLRTDQEGNLRPAGSVEDQGPMETAVPRGRDGGFGPRIVPKRRRDRRGFDDRILSMYGPGISTRGIRENLKEIDNVDVSPEPIVREGYEVPAYQRYEDEYLTKTPAFRPVISRVTDEVKGPVGEWRNRPLEPFYPALFPDAPRVNIRDGGHVVRKAVHLAPAIRPDGQKEILGMRIERNEGAKFWTGIPNGLKTRGVQDILTAAAD